MSYETDDNRNFFSSDKAHVRLRVKDYRGGGTYSLQMGRDLLRLLGAYPIGFYERASRVPQCCVFMDLENVSFLVHSLIASVLPYCEVELSRKRSGKEYCICFTSECSEKRRYTISVRMTFLHPWNSECNFRDCPTVEVSSVPLWKYRLKKFFKAVF